MNEWEPLVVKGQHIIQLLNSISDETLKSIRKDLGEVTFVNCDLIKIVEKATLNRKKRETLEQLETVSIEEPDFWDG
tara:strand:- start:367 stop:597 length:231 start_codon:yes stop_codon:yes gene_type:complete